MIIAIDIGNTDIAIGGFDNDSLKFVTRVSTDVTKTENEYESAIYQMLELKGVKSENVCGAVISSVVPTLSSVMHSVMKGLYGGHKRRSANIVASLFNNKRRRRFRR